MTKITKGVEVWMFGAYNHGAKVYAYRMTITSWGKKQGTAVRVDNGKNIESRLYVEQDAKNIVPVGDLPDPTAEGMRRAVVQKAEWIKHYVERAHWYLDDACKGYHESMKADCEKLLAEEPAFILL